MDETTKKKERQRELKEKGVLKQGSRPTLLILHATCIFFPAVSALFLSAFLFLYFLKANSETPCDPLKVG